MAKVIEFYVRDPFPKKAQSIACDRRGEVIKFPKDKPTAAGQTTKIREHDEGDLIDASWPGCF